MTTIDLSTIIQTMQAAREQMKAHGQTALGQAFKVFFDACPEVQGIVWAQYAPYFNDGDACVFRVREPQIVPYPSKVASDLAEAIELDPGDDEVDLDDVSVYESCMLSAYGLEREDNEQEARVRVEWSKIEPAFAEEDLFQQVFGDDCKVIATRDGFKVTEHEHD
jgi:hypothetical protein